jgi:hypothetical protein
MHLHLSINQKLKMFNQEPSNGDKQSSKIHEISSTTILLNGNKVKIHGVCIGRVAKKSNSKKKIGYANLSRLNHLLESYYKTFLPIWIWVIEHHEGLIVVDADEIIRISDLDKYLTMEGWSQKYRLKDAARFLIEEKQELQKQFESIMLTVEDIKFVILLNLNLENEEFSKLLVSNNSISNEGESKVNPKKIRFIYPGLSVLEEEIVVGTPVEIFNKSYPITQAEDLFYVPNPRQKDGIPFVKFRTDEFDILFSGNNLNESISIPFLEEIFAQANRGKDQQEVLGNFNIPPTIHLSVNDEYASHKLLERTFIKQ